MTLVRRLRNRLQALSRTGPRRCGRAWRAPRSSRLTMPARTGSRIPRADAHRRNRPPARTPSQRCSRRSTRAGRPMASCWSAGSSTGSDTRSAAGPSWSTPPSPRVVGREGHARLADTRLRADRVDSRRHPARAHRQRGVRPRSRTALPLRLLGERWVSAPGYHAPVGRCTWDPEKERINIRRRGISFLEAETAVEHPLASTLPDLEHSAFEERYRTIGWSSLGRLLVVVTSEGGPRPRIISAWHATKRDRRAYERHWS